MIDDDRFDRLIVSALGWQADEAAREAPSLERSVRRLAERLGPEPVRLEPRVVARSGSGRSLQLIVAVLLLIAVLAAALAIGTQLLPRRGLEPAPFGYAGECFTPVGDEILYTVTEGDAPFLVYKDGRIVKYLSNLGETRSAIFELGGLERRLAPRGQELILERIARIMPEPGCRHLRAQAATGEISVFTPEGLIELSWHPSNPGRRLTTVEEADAEELERALASPETWLPANAWLDATERRATPDRWLIMVELTPSGYGPGDEVTLSTGAVLEGSDPRYARVVLPGGQEPAEFGEEVAQRDSTTVRCGVLGTADARALSDSLDALPLAMHDEEELFTDDLSRRVFIYIATGYPGEPDCAKAGRDAVAPNPTPTPAPTPRSGDDLAGIDPCSLMPASVDAVLGTGLTRRIQPTTLAMGTHAQACVLEKESEFGPSIRRASLTLYPKSLDGASARTLADSVLGGGLIEESIGGRPAWVNECLAAAMACGGAIAVWSDPYFLVIEFPVDELGGSPGITLSTARSVVEAVVMSVPR